MKKPDFKNFSGLFLFGKILSAGLVIAGYTFLSVWCFTWLNGNGFNIFISLLAIPLITGFGAWQAWLFLMKFSGEEKKESELKKYLRAKRKNS